MKYRLSDLCEYRKEKVPVSDIKIENYISTENMLPNKEGITLATSSPNTGKVSRYKKGDILISNIRPYFQKIWLANREGACSNDILIINANCNISNEYLYYSLTSNEFFLYMMSTSKGTKMPRGDKKAIMQFELDILSREKQEKAITLLSLLDKKIHANRMINNNLEQQAMAIYKQCFDSDVNQEWKKGVLSDVADITMGQSPSGTSLNAEGNGILFFQGKTDFSFRFPRIRLFTTEPKRMASTNDILMSVRAPVGDLNVAHIECCIGRGLAAIRSKSNHQSFIFYTLRFLKRKFDSFNGEGTVFGSINKQALNNFPILIPPAEKIDEFETLVSFIDLTIRNNYNEIHRLNQMRDTLLPKLISGEVDVSNIDL